MKQRENSSTDVEAPPGQTGFHRVLGVLDRPLRYIENVMMVIACVAVILMMIAIAADGTGRYLFNQPIVGIREVVTRYLMIAGVWLAFAFTQRQGGHVAIDMIMRRTPQRFQQWVHVITCLLGVGVSFLLGAAAINAYISKLDVWTMGSVELPVAPAWLVIAIGGFALGLRLIVDALKGLSGDLEMIADDDPAHLAELESGVL